MASTGKIFMQAENVSKVFKVGEQDVEVLKAVNMEIHEGDFAIIFGPSGSGKSTLLHCLLGLEAPTSGKIMVDGKDFYAMNEDERAIYRRHRVGMIYQQPLWISSMNIIDNVVFALHLLDHDPALINQKGMQVLERVGMQDWATYRPRELSSGQQQKVSLARSLVIDPVLIVADEPTGNLDTVSGQNLIQTFLDVNAKGLTIIMITHELEYLKYANRLIHVVDGEVVENYITKKRVTKVKVGEESKDNKTITLHDKDYAQKLGL